MNIDNMIPEEEIEKYYTTREVLPPEYEESMDKQPLIDFDNELIPF